MRYVSLCLALALVSACASQPRSQASLAEAALTTPVAFESRQTGDYRIGPSDKLRLTVFQVADLSFEEIRVDAGGNLQLPLIGTVVAAGQTPAGLSSEIQLRLRERFLRNPQVSVIVLEATNQKITVDGAVTKPGVYEMQGRTTLLQAVAMAEGVSRVANTREVAVFRTDDDGHRQVAVFDLQAVRQGLAADPVMQGDDIIVVDTSRLSSLWRDIIAALPAFSTFAYFR